MKAKELIGLTVVEALEKIKRAEAKSETYQFYICTLEHKQKSFFKYYKNVHYRNENGKRCYRVVDYDLLTFIKDEKLQANSFILECEIKQETHDNWSFNGYVNTATHNVYYLFIDGIAKGNKGREIIQNKKEQIIEYKEGELTKKQRRFTL